MATVPRETPLVSYLIAETNFYGKAVTMLKVDFNVDADGSTIAMQAALNTIQAYGNIVMASDVTGTGQLLDVIIEGAHTGTDYVSADGTVTGTIAQAMAEDLLNLGTKDTVNFAAGTPTVTVGVGITIHA